MSILQQVLIVFAIWLFVNQAPVYGQGSNVNSSFFTPNSNPYGKSYEEWAKNWWQWHISLPQSVNPKNVSVTSCPVLNNGQVSFIDHRLVGNYEFICTIPANTAVLTTILSGESDTDEIGSNDEKAMLQSAKEGGDLSTTAVTLDNVSLKGYDNRITTKFFNITIPKDNVYGANEGTFKSVVDGYFLFLKPLPKGEHNVNIKVLVNNPSDPNFTTGYNANLKLLAK
jgi:hypothetical protein